MGRGIERRATKMAAYWGPHLERSKQAQQRWASASTGREVAILGAGRLMDVDLDALGKSHKTLWLIDADPISVTTWRNLQTPVRWDLVDVSGVQKSWTRIMERTTGSWQKFLDAIESLPCPAHCFFLAEADGVISLNLLSQIPVVWQDILEEILNSRFGHDFVAKREQQWLSAFAPKAKWLVEQHLTMLASSRANNILIITDLEYGRYLDLIANAEYFSALYGIDLGCNPTALLPGYTLDWTAGWDWHISPLGLESKKQGTVHKVGALAFKKNQPTDPI